MALVRRLIGVAERPDLRDARKENVEARESFLKAVRAATERGHTITLSQEALERIVKVEPDR
jgi:hypothetical protein